jgi:hypothetical protein
LSEIFPLSARLVRSDFAPVNPDALLAQTRNPLFLSGWIPGSRNNARH